MEYYEIIRLDKEEILAAVATEDKVMIDTSVSIIILLEDCKIKKEKL